MNIIMRIINLIRQLCSKRRVVLKIKDKNTKDLDDISTDISIKSVYGLYDSSDESINF
jgi:hypothetical protein